MSTLDQPHHWVLVRGLGREKRHWGPFPDLLKKAFPQGQVTCIDLPGVGDYASEKSPTSISEIARITRERFFKTHKEGTPVIILSISLGAMVVFEWLKQDPKGIRAAFLVNTSLRGVNPLFKRMQPGALARLLASVMAPTAELKEGLVLSTVSNRPELARERLPLWVSLRREGKVSVMATLSQLLAAVRYSFEVPTHPTPILLINSSKDRLAHESCSQVIAAKLSVPLVTHPTAGHDIPIDDPEWLISQFKEWDKRA